MSSPTPVDAPVPGTMADVVSATAATVARGATPLPKNAYKVDVAKALVKRARQAVAA